jgi:hypothetical protein
MQAMKPKETYVSDSSALIAGLIIGFIGGCLAATVFYLLFT